MLVIVFLTLLFALTFLAITGVSAYLLWCLANILKSYDVELR